MAVLISGWGFPKISGGSESSRDAGPGAGVAFKVLCHSFSSFTLSQRAKLGSCLLLPVAPQKVEALHTHCPEGVPCQSEQTSIKIGGEVLQPLVKETDRPF